MDNINQLDYHNNRFLMFVIDQLAYEFEKEGKEIIRMTLGKSELPMHPDIIRSMEEALKSFKKYTMVFPSGLPELKEELARFYEKKYQVSVNPQNIIISVGTSTIFRNIYDLLLKEGDEVLIPKPYYALYKFCALFAGAKIRYYNIDYKTLSLDLKSLAENFTDKTRIVVINSPGNPLGNVVSKKDFFEIDEIVDDRAVIISDEIYANICFDMRAPTVMDTFGWGETSKAKSRFIITNSFSKAYRMYSRRVGWCVVPDEFITPLSVIQHHTLLTVDPVVQFAGTVAIKHPEELEYIKNLYQNRRDYTVRKFKSVPSVNMIPAKGSFYCTLDCSQFMREKGIESELDLAEEIIKSIYVATVPGSDFGAHRTLRLSFTCAKYKEGINKLCDFFTQ